MADIKRKFRWMPVVLGLSLALNLAVVAALSGAMWRHKDTDRAAPRGARGGAVYMQALPREVRRDMYRQLRAGLLPNRDTADLLGVLRQEPFDPAAAARVLDAQRDAGVLRQDAASAAFLAHIIALSADARRTYADRLQNLEERRGSRKSRRKE